MPDIVSSRKTDDGLLYIICDMDETGEVAYLREMFRELRGLLENRENSEVCRAIAIRVGGDCGAATGYPVTELLDMTQNEARRFCFESQDTVKLIRALEIPSYCLMGGTIAGPSLEIALACEKRILSLDTGSCIRFPEIGMGIIPPFGGVFDLIAKLGVPRVLDLLESCASIPPAEALELGIVDHLARADMLTEAAYLLSIHEEQYAVPEEGEGPESLTDLLSRLWSDNRVRKLVQISAAARRAERSLNPGVREAFVGVLEMIREGLSSGIEEGLLVGARNFTDLLSTQSNRSILSLSGKRSRLVSWVRGISARNAADGRIITVLGDSKRSVEWVVRFASKGFAVRHVTDDIRRFSELMKERLHGGERCLNRIFPTTHTEGLESSALVIAANGDREIQELGGLVRKAVSITSSPVPVVIDIEPLPFLVSELPLQSKHRVYGITSFGVDEKKTLVELSLLDDVQEDGLHELLPFFSNLDTLTVVIRESPGGLCRRILTAFLTEALRLIEEGVGLLRIEEAALSAGLSVGPFWILDNIGLSNYLETSTFLNVRLGERFQPPGVLSRLQELGVAGRSASKGFYVHSDETPYLDDSLSPAGGKQVDPARYDEVIQERLFYSVVGEAVRVFSEGVTPHPEIVDVAVDYLGIFPSHLGGPLHHAALTGTAQLVRKFEKLYRSWGVQFEPPDLLYSNFSERTPSPFTVANKV